jgi:hypothetical protein
MKSFGEEKQKQCHQQRFTKVGWPSNRRKIIPRGRSYMDKETVNKLGAKKKQKDWRCD